MENEAIKSLLEALSVSPDNVPLRIHVAQLMLAEKMYAEAAAQFQLVLEKSYGNEKAQLGLARCYFSEGKFAAASIIYEQIQDKLPLPDMVYYIKCLVKDGAIGQAVNHYQQLLAMHPDF